uniref:Golgi SNAP receptor complex member 2 n=1 Tax=Clytia hemisphaerica TaxID=252671 RepID=A0A7M5VE69_9CNID
MENLLQQTNRLVFQLQNDMSSLGRTPAGEALSNLEMSIQQNVQEVYKNCSRLEEYVFKEPPQRKQASKLKVDQIIYDIRHIDSSYKGYIHKKRQQEAEERRREELMSMPFRTNAENDTKISMDYALQHHDALQGADRNIGQMRHTGMSALEQMKNQRMSLKGVRRRMMDIGNTLGLSNTVMRMIDKRGTQDKWIVYGGIILTLLIMFLTIKYLT